MKFERTVPRLPSFISSNVNSEFGYSQEGLTGVTESYYTHDYGLLPGKDTYENQPKEEKHKADSRRVLNAKLLLSPGCVTILVLMCDSTRGELATRKLVRPQHAKFLLGLHSAVMVD